VSDHRSEAVPIWRRDLPYEAAAEEEEVTRREFARYLVLGAGAMAVGNVGLAVWTQRRSINTGEPWAIVPLAAVPVGDTYLFRYPSSADPAVLLRVGQQEVVAFSQKSTHLGCIVCYQPMALPVPRRELRDAHRRRHLRPTHPTAGTDRRRDP
jgi:arsenite oxidase small subunit